MDRPGPESGRGIATILVGILVVAALARLVLAVVLVPAWERASGIAPFPDLYPALAASLVDRSTLGYAPYGAEITTGRGPGFPAWLAVPMLAGIRNDGAIAWWATLPGLLGAALAAWGWFRFRGGALGAALAAGIAALHPLPAFVAARGMSDEFCGVLGFAGLLAWWCAESDPPRRWAWTVVSGLALGGAMLTRSSAILFLVAAAGATLVGRTSWRRMSAIALIALLPALAWSWRSSALEERPVFVHSLTAYNFWLGEAQDRYGFASSFGESRRRAHALMATEGGLDVETARTLLHSDLPPDRTAAIEKTLARSARARVAENPTGYAWRALRGTAWFWVRAETGTRTAQYAAAALPLVLVAAAGAIAAVRRSREPWIVAVALAAALHAVAYGAICPMARYSVQVYPCLALLAAAAFDRRGSRG